MKGWLAVLLLGWATLAGAEGWSFALIGDTPYSAAERAELPDMLTAISQSDVEFIAHIGDFKSGNTLCNDARFEDRRQLFEHSPLPFIFVPGDNEWTDCQRLTAGGYDPLERLNKLRSLFWADDWSLGGKKLRLERQPGDYPEHARFQQGGVLFITLNVPGPDNNWGLGKSPKPEFAARNPLLLRWLQEGFAQAKKQRLSAVVILMQANPGFTHFNQGSPKSGFLDLLTTLRTESLNFPGQTLVLHGDTHHQQIDHPLRDEQGKMMPRLTRVESYGYPFMGWVKITVDNKAASLFRFEAHPWPPTSR